MLFAHGSRDPDWAKPFRKIEALLAQRGFEVRLAYLEIMRPTLAEALSELSEKVDSIRVVPLFLGYGGHIRKDLPALAAAAQPKARVTIEPPIGEAPELIEAIASLVGRR